MDKKIRKRVEWSQILEGATPIKRSRRLIVKLRYNYWKIRKYWIDFTVKARKTANNLAFKQK